MKNEIIKNNYFVRKMHFILDGIVFIFVEIKHNCYIYLTERLIQKIMSLLFVENVAWKFRKETVSLAPTSFEPKVQDNYCFQPRARYISPVNREKLVANSCLSLVEILYILYMWKIYKLGSKVCNLIVCLEGILFLPTKNCINNKQYHITRNVYLADLTNR